jgi:hypothetical protein
MSDGLTLAIGAILGLVGVYNAVQCWRGNELAMVTRHEREHGDVRWFYGGRNKYQTPWGASYLWGAGCGGFVVVFVAWLLKEATGNGDDWWLWWALTIVATLFMLGCVALLLAYFWTGLPDALRPPAQRGVKLVRGEHIVVRPEARPPE